MATLKAYAAAHRLRIRKDELGDLTIPGREGLIYDYGSGKLAVTVTGSSPKPPTTAGLKRWTYRRNACQRAGMEVLQDGEDEGTLVFDPSDAAQARLAIKVAGIRPKRRVNPEQRRALVKAGEASRF